MRARQAQPLQAQSNKAIIMLGGPKGPKEEWRLRRKAYDAHRNQGSQGIPKVVWQVGYLTPPTPVRSGCDPPKKRKGGLGDGRGGRGTGTAGRLPGPPAESTARRRLAGLRQAVDLPKDVVGRGGPRG